MDELKQILLEKDFEDIIGQEGVKKQLKSALLMDRHVIIAGAPGIGKTTLARNIAKLLPEVVVNDCAYNCLPQRPVCPECKAGKTKKKKHLSGSKRFVRIQGSPDLTAEDLLGDIDPIKALKFGPLSLEAFIPGKIFKANNGVLFFDEINRCPEKLQNALLQVLEERKATIASYDVDLEADFIFIGTMNPFDSSTERLSDVFIDRFDIIHMAYPETNAVEKEIVRKKGKDLVEFPNKLFSFMISFVRFLRESEELEKMPSVRASIGLYERAQANALLRKSKKVSLADIKGAVVSVLAHRISLKPSAKYLISTQDFVKQKLKKFLEDRPIREKGGCR